MTVPSKPPGLAAVASLGLQLAVSFLLPTAGGIWLDGRWGTSPVCLLLGMLLGLGLAGVALRELVRKSEGPKGGEPNGR